jgi:FlaA1/EpsC-like NDP-sugar epimerase
MKAASLLRILTTWQKNKGCHYNVTGSRPGERIVEYLIGNTEIDNTEKIMFQNNIIPHYLIHPNQKVKQPLLNIISSENTTQLTDGEILNLINHKSQNFS